MTTKTNVWSTEATSAPPRTPTNIVGYDVHATDGDIGKIDEASTETAASTSSSTPGSGSSARSA